MKTIENFSSYDTAKLIYDGNIVSFFQGRSESGPRAFGNRSILFSPIIKNMNDVVNSLKGREHYRPVAGSVLQENAKKWFDMLRMKDSPFMSYAVKVLDNQIEKIPAITHIDGTCRIQTVTKKQNKHYYHLISNFYKISKVPILGNTSFNLAGDPLVETLDDAFNTLSNSKIKYLFLPEKKQLIINETDEYTWN